METSLKGVPLRERGVFLLVLTSLGHGITHVYGQSFWVIYPRIVEAMALGPLATGAIPSLRFAMAAAVSLGGGPLMEMVRRQWGLLLTACMVLAVVAYLLVGAVPVLGVLVIAVALIGVEGSLWHMPALATLSRRFPQRRGAVVTTHGMGGTIGDTVGPFVAGIALTYLLWRNVLLLYAIPGVLMIGVVWWSLGRIGGDEGGRPRLAEVVRNLGQLLRERRLLALLVAAGFRHMGYNALAVWLPLYLARGLQFSDFAVGFHVALLTFLGIASNPLLGTLSDRLGRKRVVVPGLLAMAGLSVGVVLAGSGIGLTLAIAALGIFYFSTQDLLAAAVLDVGGSGREATSVGLFFGAAQLFAAFAPLIAGAIVDAYGMEAAFYYIGAVVLVAALGALVVPMRR